MSLSPPRARDHPPPWAAARREPCARRPVRRRRLGGAAAPAARARAGRRADDRRGGAPESPAARRGQRRRRGVLRRAGGVAGRPVPRRADRRRGAGARAEALDRRRGARRRATPSSSGPPRELGADVVAVAHTRDDQAETFLLRLLRGAGHARARRRSTRAPGASSGRCSTSARDDLRAYLAARGQAFREDASNADLAIPRNRVRHELIPALRSRFSPGITDVLAREAALARQDEEFLHAEAIKLAGRIVLTDVAVRIDAAGLSSAPRALSSRVAQAALQRLAGSKSITFDHVERLLALADGAGDGRLSACPGSMRCGLAEPSC